MKKPTTRTSTAASTLNAFSAQISRICVHQRSLVHTNGPRINADAADLHEAAQRRKLFFLAFSLRPSRLRGESGVPH